jgi:protein TonB
VESSVRASAEEEPAELVSKVDPPYPEAARRSGVEGTVVLDVRIDESGAVTDIQVLRGLPLGVSEAAVAAVSRWKYRPARGRTGPVTSHKTVRVIFRLGP